MRSLALTALVAAALMGPAVAGNDDVAEAPEQVRPLLIGATAPRLTLRTGDGAPFDLNEALARKPTILILYRGGW